MTPGHPSPEQLAAFQDGLPVDAGTSAHVPTCDTCQRTLDELGGIRPLLADLGHAPPPPAPDWVHDRLQRALDAERATPETAAPAAGTTVVPLRRRRPGRVLVAAAALGAVAVGGYVLGQVTDGSGSDATVASDAGAAMDVPAEESAPTGEDQEGTRDGESSEEVSPDAAPEASGGAPGTLSTPQGGTSSDLNRPEVGRSLALEDQRAAGDQATELRDVVLGLRDAATVHVPGCGDTLAGELDGVVVGSSALQSQVLVVVDVDGETTGWVLPTCEATVDESDLEVTVQR